MSDGITLAIIATRAGGYGCALVAAGGAAFCLLCARHELSARPLRRLAAVTAAAGVLLAGLELLLRTVFLGGGRPVSALDPALLALVGGSPVGTAAALRTAGLLATIALWRARPRADAIAWIGSVAIIGSFALSGHVLGEPRWLLALLVSVHTAAVAFWVAALPGLWLMLRTAPRDRAAVVVAAFGRRAQWGVAALVAAGAGLLVLLAGSLSGLVRSDWGWIAGAKLVAVAGLLALAAYNKLRLTPALADGDAGAARSLRRTIAAECALAAAVLVLTAMLTSATPPGA